ncbi:MAG: glycoside hydrolase family 9 protein [Synechococcales bacterium]|nr:glycoside hydrolase family 9 protein [Synechococcales bacterium]
MNNLKFSITNDWGSGFTAGFAITNTGQTALNGWTVEFNAPFQITNIWNAEIVERRGDRYTIRSASWNRAIAPNQTISFGFNGKNSNGVTVEPTNLKLNGGIQPAPMATPNLTVNDVSLTEGSREAAFTVNLSAASTKVVEVGYRTANDSAKAGQDYRTTTGTLRFAPGETTKTIRVPIINDNQVETSETFKLRLLDGINANITDSQGIATLLDDDVAASPSLPKPPQSPQPKPSQPEPSQPKPAKDPGDTPAPGGAPGTGDFNYGEALQKSLLFYEAQRSGPLPDDNRIEWRGDSALKDGQDVGVDLTGGYYDAGDHVKFGFPMAASMTMLSWGVVEYLDGYKATGQLDEVLDAIKWGTDYILKAHVTDGNGTKEFWGQVGNGQADHAYWGSAEDMTMARPAYKIDRQNPGSDLAGESAAALAAASIAFRSSDPRYADRLLQNAVQLFEFADTYRGKYSDSITDARNFYNSWSGYQDELAWSATWLYKATGDRAYLNKAESYYRGLNPGWTQNWDDKSYGTALMLAQETDKAKYHADVQSWLNYWSDDSGAGVDYTDGGLAWLSQWGSLRYTANTAFLAGIYSDTTDEGDRYASFAEDQIDYLLGDNPRNFSYMVGFGDDSPQNPHHRGSHGGTWANFNSSSPNEFTLYGALVGGPASANDFDYKDDRTDYIRNEVALDYNAGFTGALARLAERFGGDPLTNAQLDALPGIAIANP